MKQKSLTAKAGIIVLGNTLQTVVSLLLPIILIRIISPSEYGTYRQVILIYTTLIAIFVFGLPQSMYYFLPQLAAKKQWTLIYQSFMFLLLIGIIVSLLLLFFSGAISILFNNPNLESYLKIIGVYILFQLPTNCFVPIMICLEKHTKVTLQKIIFNFLYVIAVVIPLYFGYGLKEVFLMLILLSMMNLIYIIIVVVHNYKMKMNESDFSLMKNQFKYALPVGISSIVGTLLKEIDKFIISSYFLPSQFAIYSIGAREVPFVSNVTYSISGVIRPKLVEYFNSGKMNQFFVLWHRTIRKTALIIYPIFIFLFIYADKIIVLLYTENYSGSIIIFRIYLSLLLIRFTSYSGILLSMGFSKDVLISAIIAFISNIILNIVLIEIIGFRGAAIATVLVVFINAVYLLFRIKIITKKPFVHILPWKIITQIFSVALLSGIIIYFAFFLIDYSIINIIIAVILFMFVFIGLGVLFKVIEEQEIQQLKYYIFKKWRFFKN